ncbi:MAG: flagellar filament capping protein FliD [Pseudomonadota bacterium]
MASIVSTGIGSGLDIAGIVQQLVAAEGQPVENRLGQQEVRAQAKLSAFGSLKSALADVRDQLATLKSPEQFLVRKAVSSDEDVFKASTNTSALPASYELEVVRLAEAQKLTSGAFAGSDAAVGTGTLTVTVGTASMDLEIDADNNTLADIRNAINSADDNPGVSATIVNAENGSYLILTGNDTGAENTITLTQSGGDGGLAALEYDPGNGLSALTESQAAQDALIRIDGFDVVSSTNTFSGAVEGVTISVESVTTGPETLTVENDDAAVSKIVNEFIEDYNALIDTLNTLTDFNAEAGIGAPLLGDSTIRSIRDQIRREMSTAVNDAGLPFSTLSDVGIEVQLDGKLELDETRLSTVLADDFTRFGQLFSLEQGFGTRLFNLTDSFLDTEGIIETRTQGLTTQIDGIADERESLNERLASLETRLLRQFNALDSLLAQLSSTSNFLTQQLSSLPGVDRPDNG